MIADSEKRLFDVVLVWKLDRFSRDRYDSALCIFLKRMASALFQPAKIFPKGRKALSLNLCWRAAEVLYSRSYLKKIQRGQKENALKCRNNMAMAMFLSASTAQTAYWKLTLPLPHWLRKSLPVMRAAKPSEDAADSLNKGATSFDEKRHSVWHRSASPLKQKVHQNINTPTPLFQTEFLLLSIQICSSAGTDADQ